MDRLSTIHEKMKAAAKSAGRASHEVTLIAVSKTFEAEHILPVLEAGHRHFGENRVQESQKKWPSLRKTYKDVKLHLIGPLQSNKAADAVALFDVIHTLDREKIAKALAKEAEKQDRNLDYFVQVNTGNEPQKAGISPDETDDFVAFCQKDCGLKVIGLMAIPPIDEPARNHFDQLRKLASRLKLPNLSMGMSADYIEAIEAGATHIRIGSAIFGSR